MEIEPLKTINSILADQKKFKRFCGVLAIFLLAAVIALFVLLFHQSKTKSDLKIDFTNTGATVIINNNRTIAAQFLLPSTSRWTDTEIRLKPNSTVKITASGKINLAAHRAIEAAHQDTRPPLDWCSPKGHTFRVPRKKDLDRINFLIRPDAPMGVIVGCFIKNGEAEPSLQNPRPTGSFIIKEQTEIKVPNEATTLWLIINDVLLNPREKEKSKAAYFGPLEDLTSEERADKEKKWEYILANNYWDIWFDDNMGHYLIQIKEENE